MQGQSTSRQPTITSFTSSAADQYDSNHPRQEQILKLISFLVVDANLPHQFVEQERLTELMKILEPRYKEPSEKNLPYENYS